MVVSAHPVLMQRGVRVVTIRRGGERWPRACQVLLRWTIGSSRTFKPCGPGAPMLALSLDDMTCHQDDGGKQAGPRGEHGADVKTIAQGGPGHPAEPVVPAPCIFSARGPRASVEVRPSLRPRASSEALEHPSDACCAARAIARECLMALRIALAYWICLSAKARAQTWRI